MGIDNLLWQHRIYVPTYGCVVFLLSTFIKRNFGDMGIIIYIGFSNFLSSNYISYKSMGDSFRASFSYVKNYFWIQRETKKLSETFNYLECQFNIKRRRFYDINLMRKVRYNTCIFPFTSVQDSSYWKRLYRNKIGYPSFLL